jgi:hypothetical protein
MMMMWFDYSDSSFGRWLMAGADLLREESTVGCLLVAGLL